MTASRKHLAERWYSRDGLTISCRCGDYEPIKGSRRQQEDAHRAHRVAMGETVKPRPLTRVEQLEKRVAELQAHLALVHEFRIPLTNTLGGYGEVCVERRGDHWAVTDGAYTCRRVWQDDGWTYIGTVGLEAAYVLPLDAALELGHRVARIEGDRTDERLRAFQEARDA